MNKLTQIALAASVSTAVLASAALAETRTETLSSNSLITIALVDAHHEHRNVFMDELFPSVLPAIEERRTFAHTSGSTGLRPALRGDRCGSQP